MSEAGNLLSEKQKPAPKKRAKAKKPNEKLTPASLYKKMLAFGKIYQVEHEQDFLEAARIYSEEAGLIDQMREQDRRGRSDRGEDVQNRQHGGRSSSPFRAAAACGEREQMPGHHREHDRGARIKGRKSKAGSGCFPAALRKRPER